MKTLGEVELNLSLFAAETHIMQKGSSEKKSEALHFMNCLQEPTASGLQSAIDLHAALNDGALPSFPLWGTSIELTNGKNWCFFLSQEPLLPALLSTSPRRVCDDADNVELSCVAANLALTIHHRDFRVFIFSFFHSGSQDLYFNLLLLLLLL